MGCSQLDGLLVSTSSGDVAVRSQVEVSNLLVDVIQVFCVRLIMDVLLSRGRSSAWTILGGPGHRRQTAFDHRQIRKGRQDGRSSRGRLLSCCFIAFSVADMNIFHELPVSFRVHHVFFLCFFHLLLHRSTPSIIIVIRRSVSVITNIRTNGVPN